MELSTGVHRYAMYPPGHPSLAHSAAKIAERLADCLESRHVLNIGVARDRLVIEGAATDARHPVLRDLARRLHDQQVGALTFRSGVGTKEVEHLLRRLASDSEPEEAPPSRAATAHSGDRDHITVHPIGYERLTIQEGPGSEGEPIDRATELWLALAQATMTSGVQNVTGEAIPDESALADALRSRSREQANDQIIAGHLRQIIEELKDNKGRDAVVVRERVSSLIRQLDEDALRRLLGMVGDSATTRDLVLDANQTLAVDAVIRVLDAAARAAGQTVSTSMVRLLTKLSRHAQEGGERVRGRADSALRENIDRLLQAWELEDPNPTEYTQVLDGMARVARPLEAARGRESPGIGPGPSGQAYETPRQAHPGALRLVEMALEVDAWGPTVEAAVFELVDGGRVGRLAELLVDAPEGRRAADRVRSVLHDPEQLRRLLSADELDEQSLQILVRAMGKEAVPPLMDALTESESRSVRRRVFDSLVVLQKDLSSEIVRRLDDPRWYVVRNMLALIQRLDRPPSGFDPVSFLHHADLRVRREAFPLAVKDAVGREEAITCGLASDDERLIHMSLLEVQEGAPDGLASSLVSVVVRGDHPPALRALAIRALRRAGHTAVRDALLDVVAPPSGLFGKRKVSSEESPHVVAAMEVLAERWRDDPAVAGVLDAARRSGDPETRRAASTTDPS